MKNSIKLILALLFFSCQGSMEKAKKIILYKGPMAEMHEITTILSDSAKLKVVLEAPLQQEFENGDRVFPNGIKIIFFDQKKNESAILTANNGKFDKRTNTYIGTGNVIVINKQEGKKVNSEELIWDPENQKVTSKKYVRIETKTEILTGDGLVADQDFKKYKILKPSGIFSVNQ